MRAFPTFFLLFSALILLVSSRPIRRDDDTSPIVTVNDPTSTSNPATATTVDDNSSFEPDSTLEDVLINPIGGGVMFLANPVDPSSYPTPTSPDSSVLTQTYSSTFTSSFSSSDFSDSSDSTSDSSDSTYSASDSSSTSSRVSQTIKATSSTTSPTGTSSQTFKGKGTYFTPNAGACGWSNNDNDLIAALNRPQYGNINKVSPACGKMASVTGPLGTIQVKIADACPECKLGSLDLSPAAFKLIGKPTDGIIPITWQFINYSP